MGKFYRFLVELTEMMRKDEGRTSSPSRQLRKKSEKSENISGESEKSEKRARKAREKRDETAPPLLRHALRDGGDS